MNNAVERNILKVRQEIDAVDDAINALLAQRTSLVHKMKRAKGEQVAVFQPQREQAIIERVVRQNTSHLSGEAVAKIFTQIVTSCRKIEEELAGES